MPGSIVWWPTPEYTETHAASRFMKAHDIATYGDLLRRSHDVSWFWDAFIRFSGIEFYQPYTQIVDLTRGLPFPKWFTGGKINLAHNALDRWARDPKTADWCALVWEGEDGTVRQLTFGELNAGANQVANALRALGLETGSRVALFMPLIPETVMAAYGIYKAGVVAVPLFSGFGPDALAQRLRDVDAHAVITADGFYRGGKHHPLKIVLDRALALLDHAPPVIVAGRTGGCPLIPGRDYRWSEWVDRQPTTFPTVQTGAEDICMVAYSSGTSGKPKGIVHVHGGVAVKSAEVSLLNYDMRPGDQVYQITDFGWMMGQAPMLRAHSAGAALLLYEGSPIYPHAGRLFDLIDRHRLSIFGAPATALRLIKSGVPDPHQTADLSSLRLLSHTGEPIDENTWLWYFGWGKGRLPIINVSGGTEVFAEILSSTAMQPLKPACLGVTPAIGPVIVDETGQMTPPGTTGYLCFTLPQPAQTRGFWNEPEQRYLDTYFPMGTDRWWHGDMVVMDEDGFWFHRGRADDVIKISGRRTGPGEIEDAVSSFPGVLESAAIGVPHPLRGEEVIVFVVPLPGQVLIPAVIQQHVADRLGKPYQPSLVHVVGDLPRTRTGKIVRRLIRQFYLGEPLGDTSSLANPEALNTLLRRD